MNLALSYSRMGSEVLVHIVNQVFCDELSTGILLLQEWWVIMSTS